jgi:hypothetical protein
MQKLLLQTSSGCVYPWSASLAEMPGMVDYNPRPKAEPIPEPVAPAVEPEQEDIKQMAQAVLKRRKTK